MIMIKFIQLYKIQCENYERRNAMIRKITLVAILLLGIGLVGMAMTAKKADFSLFSVETVAYDKQESVNSEEITKVFLETSSIGVSVAPIDGDDITVTLDGKVSKKLKDNLKLIVEEKGEHLIIRTEMENKIQSSFGINILNVKLDVRLPQKYYEQLEIKTSSGKINVENVESDGAIVQSSSGAIDISNLKVQNQLKVVASSGRINVVDSGANTLNATTSSGSITLQELTTNDTEISASSGRVKLGNVSGNINTATSSGSITVENKQVTGDIVVKSSSGRVKVTFEETPESLAINFRGSSGSGKVNLEGVNYERNEKNEVIGVIGTGEYRLDVKTSSGSFHLN